MEKQNTDLKLLEIQLNHIINYVDLESHGYPTEKRYLVDKFCNVKIEIYPNEHAPPHFHVKSPDFDATFSILNCQLLTGRVDSKNLKKINYFHTERKQKLIEVWNALRPENCPVGKIEIESNT